jgi:hypothetical protein
VIVGSTLYYFSSFQDLEPHGTLQLSEVTVEKKSYGMKLISSKDNSCYRFSNKQTGEVIDEWIQHIVAAGGTLVTSTPTSTPETLEKEQ